MSALDHIHDIPPRKIWEGVTGRVVRGERLTLGLVELEPDALVPDHRHENEQLGLVVAGSLTFTVGEETRELGPGGTWSIPGDTPHMVRAGPEGAVVVDVFAPARADWDAIPPEPATPPRWPV